MNKTKKRILVGVAGFLTLGIATGAAAVLDTMETYSNACSKLSGFPGMLQATGFIPLGHCQLLEEHCPHHECKASNGKTGHCEAIKEGTKYACLCVPLKVSP